MKKFIVPAAVIALALAGCSDSSSSEPVTETATESVMVTATETETETVSAAPESSSREASKSSESAAEDALADVPVTVTETGFVLGDEAAKNNVTIYQDFNCPHCVNLHAAMDEEGSVAEWLEDGASVTVVPVNYLGPRTTHNFSGRAANALAMVANNYPESFLAAQAELYKIRPEKTTSELDDAALEEALLAAGIELTDADKTAIEKLKYKDWVDAATAAAAEKGVNYIPQVWVNDELKETPEDAEDGDVLDMVKF